MVSFDLYRRNDQARPRRMRAVAEEVASHRLSGSGYGPGAQAKPGAATAVTLNRSA